MRQLVLFAVAVTMLAGMVCLIVGALVATIAGWFA